MESSNCLFPKALSLSGIVRKFAMPTQPMLSLFIGGKSVRHDHRQVHQKEKGYFRFVCKILQVPGLSAMSWEEFAHEVVFW
jgi:hypothetical protein